MRQPSKHKKPIIFRKVYTRDNCFLIQEPWSRLYQFGFDGRPNPYYPADIFYINNGVVEIWENGQGVNWFFNSLLKMNKKSDKFFRESLSEYRRILIEIEKFWRQKKLKSVAELKKFIALVALGTKYFMIYYYSADDKRTPANIKKLALKVRAADSFYDNNDKLIRNTIHHLYPDISYDLALSLLERELDNPPSVRELKDRQKNMVFITDQYAAAIPLSTFLKKNKKLKFIFESVNKNTKILRGQSAYRGQATGLVRILKTKSQIASFKKGEVLVSAMTTPTYLPAMKKAAAIITDEGGITCHAAVVAREFRRPCVIGTKVATHVLRDGDKVRVDANQGFVHILD